MKILLAVDGSDASARAAAKLAETLAWYKDPPTIELLTVHLPVPKFGHMASIVTHEMVEKHYTEESAAALAPACKVLDAAGVRYTTGRAVGPIAETIMEEAQARGADLVYMGTRGMTAVGNVVLGSTATKVLHLATVPVVMVR